MRLQAFLITSTLLAGLQITESALAWGADGHRIIGEGALVHLDQSARIAVAEVLENGPDSGMGEACNWPDEVRETSEWEWSAPLHYVNIPRRVQHYERQRDCSDGMCVTEGIKKYANELARNDLDHDKRWRALAWVCHLVGDLHQPLHAGYRDDRGGNLLKIEYKGEIHNLHQFWDRVVIKERLGRSNHWERPLNDAAWKVPAASWDPAEVNNWTGESHQLTARFAYPEGRVIQVEFADRTWLITRQQWQKAIIRLALILNATLGQSEIQLD